MYTKIALILDIDLTIGYCSDLSILDNNHKDSVFTLNDIHIIIHKYKNYTIRNLFDLRPNFKEYIKTIRNSVDYLAIYSAGSPDYVSSIVYMLNNYYNIQIDDVFNDSHCIFENYRHFKSVKKYVIPSLIQKKYNINNTHIIFVDDNHTIFYDDEKHYHYQIKQYNIQDRHNDNEIIKLYNHIKNIKNPISELYI